MWTQRILGILARLDESMHPWKISEFSKTKDAKMARISECSQHWNSVLWRGVLKRAVVEQASFTLGTSPYLQSKWTWSGEICLVPRLAYHHECINQLIHVGSLTVIRNTCKVIQVLFKVPVLLYSILALMECPVMQSNDLVPTGTNCCIKRNCFWQIHIPPLIWASGLVTR